MTTIKNILVTVVVAALVSVGFYTLAPRQAATLGTSINNVQQVIWGFTKGVSLEGASKTGTGSNVVFSKSGTILAGQNQDGWTNDTGRTVYFDYGDAINTGTASSSFRISVVATSSASISPSMALTAPIANPAGGLLIDNVLLATSSPANFVINSDINAGTQASGTVPVLSGQRIIFFLRQNSAHFCTGSICETATSTNRGFNVNWYLQGHYIP